MITCRELVELLMDFVDGALPEEHRCKVEQHLKICPPCVAYLETYQLTIKLTWRLPCDRMPAELEERLRAVLAECSKDKDGGQTTMEC